MATKILPIDEHYVVHIKIDRVSRYTLEISDKYNRAESKDVKRDVSDVSQVTFKKDTLDEALTHAINHISIMRDDK